MGSGIHLIVNLKCRPKQFYRCSAPSCGKIISNGGNPPVRSPIPFRFQTSQIHTTAYPAWGWSISSFRWKGKGKEFQPGIKPGIKPSCLTTLCPPKLHNKQRIHYQFPSARYQKTGSEVLCPCPDIKAVTKNSTGI